MNIIIDQLRISDDASKMYINMHINKASYFDNFYFEELIITTADLTGDRDPCIIPSEYIHKETFSGEKKEINLVLTANTFSNTERYTKNDLSNTLFFVYVKTGVNGGVDPCAIPCRGDEMCTTAVTFDENMLHQKVMSYVSQLADDCNVPTGFADFILLWNAFKSSIETEHFIPAVKYWRMLFSNTNVATGTKGCGCHGGNGF